MESSYNHERSLHGEEDSDHDDQHHGRVVGVTLSFVVATSATIEIVLGDFETEVFPFYLLTSPACSALTRLARSFCLLLSAFLMAEKRRMLRMTRETQGNK